MLSADRIKLNHVSKVEGCFTLELKVTPSGMLSTNDKLHKADVNKSRLLTPPSYLHVLMHDAGTALFSSSKARSVA